MKVWIEWKDDEWTKDEKDEDFKSFLHEGEFIVYSWKKRKKRKKEKHQKGKLEL